MNIKCGLKVLFDIRLVKSSQVKFITKLPKTVNSINTAASCMSVLLHRII